ncbi:protein toll [Zeugodacus cucurbitae]|uniref:Protein toll n=1 Tax=Zeugodacus cucurbitae TaxID=28588 RepID=A0A0A1WWI9_ZEUCU|nr:protein toll [Zeugodacus cucurbitae]XP_028900150.1 protein toll [Zeugodacus cucurbitae]
MHDSSKLQILYLSENRWFCDCAAQHLIYTIREHRKRIPDVEQLYCDNLQNVTLLTANVGELCQSADKVERYQYVNTTVIYAALVIIILLLNIALYYKYKLEVKVWLYSHNILSCCINERELDKNKIFDAFDTHTKMLTSSTTYYCRNLNTVNPNFVYAHTSAIGWLAHIYQNKSSNQSNSRVVQSLCSRSISSSRIRRAWSFAQHIRAP